MRALRLTLGAAGLALVLVGVQHLLARGLPNLVATVVWLAGGVVAHDALVAPLVALLGVALLPRLPSWSRGAAVGGFVVLLTVTLTAVPVLGRFGAKPDDPWLLPRSYGALWLGLALAVVAVVVAAALLRRHRSGEGRP